VIVFAKKSPHQGCSPHILTSNVHADNCILVSSFTQRQWNKCSHMLWSNVWYRVTGSCKEQKEWMLLKQSLKSQ